MSKGGIVCYRIDALDAIVFVNEAWDEFAIANEGEHLAHGHVLGQSLWDFIADETTEQLYREVLERVRKGRKVQFTFRCDSPACRRLLDMHVTLAQNGMVEFKTHTLSLEHRLPMPLLHAHAQHSDEVLQICGWCKQVETGGAWVDVELIVDRLKLFEQLALPKLTHGVCPDCYKQLNDKLDEEAF